MYDLVEVGFMEYQQFCIIQCQSLCINAKSSSYVYI